MQSIYERNHAFTANDGSDDEDNNEKKTLSSIRQTLLCSEMISFSFFLNKSKYI